MAKRPKPRRAAPDELWRQADIVLRAEHCGLTRADWWLLEGTMAINGGRGRGTEGKVEIRTREGELVEVLEFDEWERLHPECLA